MNAPERCPQCGQTHPDHPGGGSCTRTTSDIPPTLLMSDAGVGPAGAVMSTGDPLIGAAAGEYQIEALIGEGGMGRVYRAVHPYIGKKAAIKVLTGPSSLDENAIKRFLLEARAVNEVRHANIVDVFSFGKLEDGRLYYAMELLEGQSLGDVLRAEGRLPPARAFPLFRDIGRALAAAHKKGIVHRDLKPDNVYIVPVDEPPGMRAKLLDFGAVKLMESDLPHAPKTRAGVALGTPAYMAPEQCTEHASISERTDLYALGVMFYQTLVGELPFDGETNLEILQAHLTKPVPVPSRAAPDLALSPECDALILQMLAKDPRKRLESAAQFCEALDAVAPTLGVAQGRKSRPPRVHAPLQPRTRPARLPEEGLLGATLGALVLGLGAIAVFARVAPSAVASGAPPRSPPVQAAPPPPASAPAPAALPPLEVGPQTSVLVKSEPPGANVIEADTGLTLGETPFTLRRPRAKAKLVLHLSKKGFEPEVVQAPLDGSQPAIKVKLRRNPPARRIQRLD